MPQSSPGRLRRAAGGPARLAAWLATPLPLGACSETATPVGAWPFITLALLLATGGAWTLGRLSARAAARQELRTARAELRACEQLPATWRWRTDAHHRLVTWQPPGQPAQSACGLFVDPAHADAGPAALAAQLRTERGFTDLPVRLTQAQEGRCGWLLSAAPHHDEGGRFDGYVGIASPTDAQDETQADALALTPVLAACTGAALVAVDAGRGWQVRHFNAAALTLWPAAATGALLNDVLRAEPDSLLQACAAVQSGAVQTLAGRRLTGFGPLPGGTRGLLLTLPAAPALEAPESDTFSFTVSHDLRAPIRVVEGFTRIVKEDYGRLLDRVGNDHLDRVLSAAARMNLMIDALLTLARLSTQPLAHQPVNLSQLAGYVVDDLRRGAPEREAEFEIEPGLGTLGDPTLLRLVLENLLGNAWKYSMRCPRAQISLRTARHGAGMAYVVRDNGAGFDMRHADRLFGLFQRLHSASDFAGHGVGLASVRRIVRRHGGEIWAEAEVGHGAAFFFTLAG